MTRTELVKIVKQSGSHFFDPATMRFFDSRIECKPMPWNIGAIRFVTSEKGPDEQRRYSIREFHRGKGKACITTIGPFQQYATRDEALVTLKQ